MPEQGLLTDFLILFGLSVVAVLVFHRARLPPIVGFLVTGVISGPFGLMLIQQVHEVEALASQIGVVLLLFTIGIEFSLQQLLRMRFFLLLGGSRYVSEMEPLLKLGAREVVPEEFETSIEIFTRVLHLYLVPHHVVERCIREVRIDGYEMLRGVGEGRPAYNLHPFLHSQSLDVYQIESGSPLIGLRLGESGLRRTTQVTVVAMQRADGSVIGNPTAQVMLMDADLLLLLGRPEELAAAAKILQPTIADTARGGYDGA